MREVARVKDARELARMLELLALRSAQLFNASNLANDLGVHRETVEHYVNVLERLFLVRLCPLGTAAQLNDSSGRRRCICSTAGLRQPLPT